MFIEIVVAVQIFFLIIFSTHYANEQKKKRLNDNQRLAEIRKLNYMADSSSSMEEGFDIDFDRTQKVWHNKHVTKIVRPII